MFKSNFIDQRMFKINKFLHSLILFWIAFVVRVTAVQFCHIFPPKDLEKIRAPQIRMRHFFKKIFLYRSVSLNILNFPAKIRMRRIFFKIFHSQLFYLYSVSKLNNNNIIKDLNFNNKSHTQANNCIVSFIFFVLYNE